MINQGNAGQRILRLEEAAGSDGIRRCALILDAEVTRTEPAPRSKAGAIWTRPRRRVIW